jgi:hypothetical protein
MRTINWLNISRELNDTLEWFVAVDAYDYCDPEPLADLIGSPEPIPEPYRIAVADILTGKRKQKKKAAAKLKVPAKQRMDVAVGVAIIAGIIDDIQFNYLNLETGETGLNALADSKGLEPSHMKADMANDRIIFMQEQADEWGVSVETIENLLRDLRKKARAWPSV